MTPADDQPGAHLSDSVYQRIVSQFRGDWATRLNVDQMFVLIDGILPFEACLYYQVLPLFLEGNRLHLGMVSPDDTSASEYVRRIISYLNYSLVSHSISSEALRVVLTAYLNHAGNQPAIVRRESVSYGHYRHSSRQPDRSGDPNERLTLVVDSPDDLYSAAESEPPISPLSPPPPLERTELPVLPQDLPQDLPEILPEAIPEPSLEILFENAESNGQARLEQSTDLPAPNGLGGDASKADRAEPKAAELNPAESAEPALVMLNLEAKYLESPVELLATLPPAELLDELLARVLLGGIGRLYFEAYPQTGRVVWSQNGVLQSVLDQLPADLFGGVIRQLQVKAQLPSLPIKQPQQAEIEYLYQRSCVLMRFRFMQGTHGEEATVQVLRGAALKFHQQQQLTKLERDAMSMAKQLQHKLNEIRTRAYSDTSLLEAKPEKLPKLLELLKNIEQQLGDAEE
jgi:type II secretory ATPase GspE/PulE/Tfp pilus assembly ATPase PilB-like protein